MTIPDVVLQLAQEIQGVEPVRVAAAEVKQLDERRNQKAGGKPAFCWNVRCYLRQTTAYARIGDSSICGPIAFSCITTWGCSEAERS